MTYKRPVNVLSVFLFLVETVYCTQPTNVCSCDVILVGKSGFSQNGCELLGASLIEGNGEEMQCLYCATRILRKQQECCVLLYVIAIGNLNRAFRAIAYVKSERSE